MSVFVGIHSLRQGPDGVAPAVADQEAAVRTISRGNDHVETWSNQRFFLCKIDVGAFPQPALIRPEAASAVGTVAAMAGHPYLAASREPSPSRQEHLASICRELDRDRPEVLCDCHGVFALCHYRLSDGRLLLSTDRMGMRPVYYYVGQEHLYFSTSLRVLEAIPAIPKRVDLQGIAECLAFNFPLGPRTEFADIRVLENGQYLHCARGEVRRESFFAWDQIRPAELSLEQLLDRSYEAFVAAVARRSADQDVCVANLSGGLDSRSIVTSLHFLGKETYTISWAMKGHLDGLIAQQFAQALGLKQVVRSLPAMPTWEDQLACLTDSRWPGMTPPPRPNLIFSGDGGSVALGDVYMTENLVTWMRTGQRRRVLEHFAARLPFNVIGKSQRENVREALTEGLKTELDHINSHDPGRDLHLFFLRNDQRRHLHPFYENIDLSRVDYLLPFCDGPFMELLVSGPVEAFLRHRFYHQWLDRFPAAIKSVAWQVYPGHLPCPVPLTCRGRTQWQWTRRESFSGKHMKAMWRCAGILLRGDFPSPLLSRWRVLAAVLLHALHLRHCGTTLETCATLRDRYARCGGSVSTL